MSPDLHLWICFVWHTYGAFSICGTSWIFDFWSLGAILCFLSSDLSQSEHLRVSAETIFFLKKLFSSSFLGCFWSFSVILSHFLTFWTHFMTFMSPENVKKIKKSIFSRFSGIVEKISIHWFWAILWHFGAILWHSEMPKSQKASQMSYALHLFSCDQHFLSRSVLDMWEIVYSGPN